MIQAPCLALASYCSKLQKEALQKHCQHCIFLQVSARLRLSQHAIDLVVGVKEGLDISAYDGSRFCKDGSHQAPNHQRQFEAIRLRFGCSRTQNRDMKAQKARLCSSYNSAIPTGLTLHGQEPPPPKCAGSAGHRTPAV